VNPLFGTTQSLKYPLNHLLLTQLLVDQVEADLGVECP